MMNDYDENNLRYVGWAATSQHDQGIKNYFSASTIKYISKKVTENLRGLDKRPIIVPPDKISHVMSQVYLTRTPKTGDIYTRYIIPDNTPTNILQEMIERCIQIITEAIEVEITMLRNNEKLSIWSTVYGDFNPQQLRQHAPIKILNKHPQYMAFNMNY
jgi:hypothetical protein